jgi:hypothetical protein
MGWAKQQFTDATNAFNTHNALVNSLIGKCKEFISVIHADSDIIKTAIKVAEVERLKKLFNDAASNEQYISESWADDVVYCERVSQADFNTSLRSAKAVTNLAREKWILADGVANDSAKILFNTLATAPPQYVALYNTLVTAPPQYDALYNTLDTAPPQYDALYNTWQRHLATAPPSYSCR